MIKKLNFLFFLLFVIAEVTFGQRNFDIATGCYVANHGAASSSALYLKSDSSFTFRWTREGVTGNTSGSWRLVGTNVEITSLNLSIHNVMEERSEHLDCINISIFDSDNSPVVGARVSHKTTNGWQPFDAVTNVDGVVQLSRADIDDHDSLRFDAFGYGSIAFPYTSPDSYFRITLPDAADTLVTFNHTTLRLRGRRLLLPRNAVIDGIPVKMKKRENGCFY
mgnify:CR=1 FL=1|jgi:hypothetical protein